MSSIQRRVIYFAIVAVLLGQQLVAGFAHNKSTEPAKKQQQNRRILVRYKEGTSSVKKDAAHFSAGAYVIHSFEVPTNLELVQVVKGISMEAALEHFREDPDVLYAEYDHPVRALFEPAPTDPPSEDPVVPGTDPRYDEQWGLHNVGQTVGEGAGTPDADINAPEMWTNIGGNKNVIIAIIDTGIYYDHRDLRKNVWVNPGEIAGNNIDDDNNGVVDDIHGANAITGSGDPLDDHGHGTHCAGIIGAESLNGVGGRGVMNDVTIISCKFLSAHGGGTTAGAVWCLNYLRDLKRRSENPVDIFATSNSWGGGPASQSLQDAIKEHQDLGILFIAAASNDGQNNDETEVYPANYPLSNIVAVAATDNKDQLAYFSNYGKRTVHLGAPGVAILSTVLNNGYQLMDGTSMATPFVSGLAGMIKANFPDYNSSKVKNLLMAGGRPVPALQDKTVSGRRIRAVDENGFGSLTCENQIVTARMSPSQNSLLVAVGDKVMLSALNINCAEPNGDVLIPSEPGNVKIRLLDDGVGIDSAPDDGLYTREWIAERPGTFEFIFPGDDRVVITVYDPSTMQTYTHSTEATFNYRQITGTPLNAYDDWMTNIQTPFPIRFGSMDQAFGKITIGSNGALSVIDTQQIEMSNTALPYSQFASLIAPFWDDLNPANGNGDIYYDTLGEAPNREFVIEWRDVAHYGSSDGATFQVVFFEQSSDILFNYLDVDFGRDDFSNGLSATIGIQTTKEKVVEFSFNRASLQSNMGIRFSVPTASGGNDRIAE